MYMYVDIYVCMCVKANELFQNVFTLNLELSSLHSHQPQKEQGRRCAEEDISENGDVEQTALVRWSSAII